MKARYSDRMNKTTTSEIREILKLTQMPGMISFAGGLPAPELFPLEEMKKVSELVIDEIGMEALQYSTTEGYPPLREHIRKRLEKQGIHKSKDDILITSGSQQGLDFSGKIFLNPGDTVICETPTYLGAINAFKAYECQFKDVKMDHEGMIMADLEAVIQETPQAKFIYVIPDFQNPSGHTWSLERRKALVEMANRYDMIIIEDNPYGELRFEGAFLPAVQSLDTEGRVIYLGTFSKTFSPGLRIGWVSAEPELLSKYIMVKQSADLQTSSISQCELSRYLDEYSLDDHIEKIKSLYRERRDLMMETMARTFPKEVVYEKPEGGLFTWVECPESVDTKDLMEKAVKKQVAFVPGASFYPNGGHHNAMRLNYSNMPNDKIVEGIERLGALLKEAIYNSEE